MTIHTLTTPRLVAEAICPSHFDDIHRLHSDSMVMKTLSADGKPLAAEETSEHIHQVMEHWEQFGFGLWIFHRQSDGEFIGRGGLKMYEFDGNDTVGLAYSVLSDHWNQGFATEIGRASVEVGFNLGFVEVQSWTLPTNRASQRVMEKLGFRYERDFEFVGLPHRLYRLQAGAWTASGPTIRGIANFPKSC